MKTFLISTTIATLVSAALLLGADTPNPSGRSSGNPVDPSKTPEGLSGTDWSGIRGAYERGRHAIVVNADGTHQARNPGQQWLTKFDGRGFTVTPDAGGWSWGLELAGYGEVTEVRQDGGKISYVRGDGLTEWFVNDTRGLEQGWTLARRPTHAGMDGPIRLQLALRGSLHPQVSAEGASVAFVSKSGGSALTYGGLKAWDADGKVVQARFAEDETESKSLCVEVDDTDARYPITIDPVAQQAYLKASNTATGDNFGYSVAISGDTVVVGARGEDSSATGVNGNQADNSATDSGAVYVFVRSGTTWTQQAYLKASNTGTRDGFGESVAISGNTVVVGANCEDSSATGVNGNQADNSATDSGAAYVFVRSGTTWTQQAYLKASNTGTGDKFGYCPAVDGNTVVIGAFGEDSSATGVNGNQADNSATDSGAAYVFMRSGTTWSQQAYLKASNTGAGDLFGCLVALSGDTAIVGAYYEDSSATGVNGNQADNSATDSGAAYVFVRSDTTWSQQAYLKASNTGAGDFFGVSVALSGNTAVVGAIQEASAATEVDGNQADNTALNTGAAYVFARVESTWSQQRYLKTSNAGVGDKFGHAISISGDTVVIGTRFEDSNAIGVNGIQADNSATDSGAAYVFNLTPTSAINLDFVTVGNVSNAPDPLTGYGTVDHVYNIGKYEVTNAQYATFLNAKGSSNSCGIYDSGMASYGITQSGSSGSYTYSVTSGFENKPVVFVSWFDMARFTNWLSNGQGYGDMETGAYTLGGATSGNAVTKNSAATVYLPSEDEWYKAAYYNGATSTYSLYPNGQNSITTMDANYNMSVGASTNVGSYSSAPSAYGTFDQGGNVWELNDLDALSGSSRGLRGGSWDDSFNFLHHMASSGRATSGLSNGSNNIGFRVASVPEPPSLPVVSSISAVQRAGTQLVDITYDVTAELSTVWVGLEISSDGGITYSVPAVTFSGAIGNGVATGTGKVITWNAGADWSNQYSTALRFKVTANDAPPGFSLIPAGNFQMGNAMAADTDITDAPIRTVTVSAFYMEQNLVTKSDWDTVRTWGLTHGYTDLAAGAGKASNNPVQTITWYDVVKWCNARSEKDGLTPCYTVSGVVYRTGSSDVAVCNWAANGYRLPTEAEWEKAARGGLIGKRFPWGDTISQSQANYQGSTSSYTYDSGPNGYNSIGSIGGTNPATSPVGSFPANGYGLYDMAGNVFEWCWDWYGTYAAGEQTDPRGAVSGTYRVFRGGVWNDFASYCRVAHRYDCFPTGSDYAFGFRVVRSSVMPDPVDFSLIPAGSFQMGDALDGITSAPIRTVTMSLFYMGRNLVTKADWGTVRTWGLTHGYTDLAAGAGKAANHPVQSITWYDMVKWCNARSEKDGLTACYTVSGVVYRTTNSDAVVCNWSANGYRLPTEAEWEKAARGGLSGKRFPWGDTISQSQANYHSSTGSYTYDLGPTGYNSIGSIGGTNPATSPVGSFPANGYGLYDMAGNVWGWCWDWYSTYASGAQTDPRGADSGTFRIARGGCWYYSADDCRVAKRDLDFPDYARDYVGFRVARSLVLPQPVVSSSTTVDTRDYWKLITSTLSHGAITGISGSGNYLSGTTATLTAAPAAGYVFTGWTGAATGTANPLSLLMDGDKTIGATFAQCSLGNVRASQRAGTKLIDICYDITSITTPVAVSLEISSDGGVTWTVPATTLVGAIGRSVMPGANLQITWDMGVDWNYQTSNQTKFRIMLDDLSTDSAVFSYIPGGSFTMGDALDGLSDAPLHTVNVSAFYMQKKGVTKMDWDGVREWGLLHGYTDLAVGACKANNHPVQTVSWYDVVKWCNARSEMEGLTPCYYTDAAQTSVYRTGNTDIANAMVKWLSYGYRLPTEAEWEKAARGGLSGKRFPWGDIISHTQANFRNNGGEAYQTGTTDYHPTYYIGDSPYTSPVGSFAANGYGLFDMAGNVWEWCWDWHGPYATGIQTDPRGAVLGSYREGRGGNWNYNAIFCLVALRSADSPGNGNSDLGFRPVRINFVSAESPNITVNSGIVGNLQSGLDVRTWQGITLVEGTQFVMPGTPTHSSYAGTLGYATGTIHLGGSVNHEHFASSDSGNSGVLVGPMPTGYLDNFTVEYRGKVYISNAGTYRFATTSDDGSALWIDPASSNPAYSSANVKNAATQAMTLKSSGQVSLSAGYHEIIVRYYNVIYLNGSNGLYVQWDTTGGTSFVDIPGENFYHGSPTPIPEVVPLPVTNPESGVTFTTAILNGTINPSGFATSAQFEYGLTTSYGNVASITFSPNNGWSEQSVSASVSGLQQGATYHYRLTATNGAGTGFGGDMSFTVPRMSTVSTLSGLTINSGTLSPIFSTGALAYTTSVPNAITGIKVTPTVDDPTATVKVNGVSVTSGTASASIPLVVGPNVITMLVTAQDSSFTSAYTVTVTRPALKAAFVSAISVPATLADFTTPANVVDLSLAYAPSAGTNLMVVRNTVLGFLTGRFANLAQGQVVTLPYNNDTYRFVVNYFGGAGNDLVLQWADNKEYTWGSNSLGQLGDNDSANSSVPVAVMTSGVLTNKIIVSMAVGASHSVALCSDGTVAAWGNNTYGQLGDGTNNNSNVPVAVVMSGPALFNKTVVAVAAGFNHSLALCSDGTVAAWGFNSSGQLGNNNNTSSNVPVAVTKTGALLNKTVVAVAAGYNHSLARCADGAVVTWGNNAYGQLGNNTTSNSNFPVVITTFGELNGRTVISLMGGSDHSLALCSDGSLVAWGRNNNGQLGNGGLANSSIPVAVDSSNVLSGRIVAAIATGGWHNLALCSDGTLASFGRNDNGQLGNNSTSDSNVPVRVTTATGALFNKTITAIGGGNAHSLALCSDGTLAAWGSNATGQLGNNSTTSSNVPVEVARSTLGSGETFADLASGPSASHVMALAAFHISSNPTLANLSISGGSLSPVFNTYTTDYVVGVPNATASVTVTPTATQANAIVKVNGVSVVSGTASASIPLVVGINPITVAVTAQDGVTTQTYTMTVTRYSNISTLAGLTLSEGTLSPGFATATKIYSASVANAITSVTVTPTVTDATATVKVNGDPVTPGVASSPISLVVGSNPISVLVTAEDGTTTTTYTVTVLRISNDSTLADLTLSTGALSPVFAPGTTSYASSTAYSTTSLTVTPTTHAAATMTINGTPLASGATSLPIALVVGPNTIEVKVTAEDEVTVSTYTVIVTRPPLYATFTSAASIGVTSSGYAATGNTLSISLGYAPTTGTNLSVINNTELGFITGRFANLAQGQAVALTYNGVTYQFIANYYGGTGNDLVLQWANTRTYAWGYNNNGQLGNGTTNVSKVPISVTSTGVLNGKTVIAVSCGGSHSLALCADGTVAAWGSNNSGQLGNGSTTNSTVPVAVSTSGVLSGKTVIAVAAGNGHSLALCADGTVATWGYNGFGELGNGGSTNSSIPVDITTSGVLSVKSVVAIAAGWSHSLALCSDGTVAAWGYNAYGQLGNTTTGISRVPVAVSTAGVLSGKAVAAISAGSDHNLALCVNGTVVAWGYNNRGQLGDNSQTNRTAPVAVSTAGGLLNKAVTAVAAGGSHSLARCLDGTVAAWGYNNSGQLGNSTTTSSSIPVAVSTSGTLFGKSVTGVSAGSSHSLAQCSDGTMAAWGDNANGQLGNNSTSNSNVPVAVSTAALGTGGRFMTMATGPKAMHSVAVVPISTNSCLAGLVVGSGMLSPVFSPATFSYLSNVPGSAASVSVTPTSSDPAANVKVNGTTVASGSASGAISLGSSAVNTITVVVTAQDGVTTTTYTVTIDNTPFGIWKKTVFTDPAELGDPAVSGDLATPANDGITNLMKHAMALEPMACGTGGMPTVAQQAGYLTLTYRKSKTATDVIYTVQAADSLDGNAWAPATTVTSQADQGDHWLVTVRDIVPYTGQARRFMRLQVGK